MTILLRGGTGEARDPAAQLLEADVEGLRMALVENDAVGDATYAFAGGMTTNAAARPASFWRCSSYKHTPGSRPPTTPAASSVVVDLDVPSSPHGQAPSGYRRWSAQRSPTSGGRSR